MMANAFWQRAGGLEVERKGSLQSLQKNLRKIFFSGKGISAKSESGNFFLQHRFLSPQSRAAAMGLSYNKFYPSSALQSPSEEGTKGINRRKEKTDIRPRFLLPA